jgi:hypothetical protein
MSWQVTAYALLALVLAGGGIPEPSRFRCGFPLGTLQRLACQARFLSRNPSLFQLPRLEPLALAVQGRELELGGRQLALVAGLLRLQLGLLSLLLAKRLLRRLLSCRGLLGQLLLKLHERLGLGIGVGLPDRGAIESTHRVEVPVRDVLDVVAAL